jgi:hypothetical protein
MIIEDNHQLMITIIKIIWKIVKIIIK